MTNPRDLAALAAAALTRYAEGRLVDVDALADVVTHVELQLQNAGRETGRLDEAVARLKRELRQ